MTFRLLIKKKKIFLLTVATKGRSSDTHKVKSFMFGKSRVFLYPTIFVRRGPSSRCSANEPTLFPSPLERIQKSGCCREWYILVYQGINIWSKEAKWKAFFFFFFLILILFLSKEEHTTRAPLLSNIINLLSLFTRVSLILFISFWEKKKFQFEQSKLIRQQVSLSPN